MRVGTQRQEQQNESQRWAEIMSCHLQRSPLCIACYLAIKSMTTNPAQESFDLANPGHLEYRLVQGLGTGKVAYSITQPKAMGFLHHEVV